MSTIDGVPPAVIRPSKRRCSVSFQDICTVIPERELSKPRLCTRTYSLCLSKKPSPDLLYDETFIPSHPTTLTFHLPSFTRAPPLPGKKRPRRSSTGGTAGAFGYKGEDTCGLKSCLHKSAHAISDALSPKEVTSSGLKETPPIVHRDSTFSPASSAISTPARSVPSILSPIRRNSITQDGASISPTLPPTSPISHSGGFGISKVSSFVTRPFLRRSKTSSSVISGSSCETDTSHAPLLKRARSTSVSAAALEDDPLHASDPIITRAQSLNFPPPGDDLDHSKTKVRPMLCETVRHPGCIDEDVIEEEELEENGMAVAAGASPDDHNLQHPSHPPPLRRLSILNPPVPAEPPAVIPIHDCCEDCTRNALLGMREDYTPPFSQSAIRKIQREREEKEHKAGVERDVAGAAAVVVEGPKKIWDGQAWVEEPEAVAVASEQCTDSRRRSNTDETEDDGDDNEVNNSLRDSTFNNEKARTMMVDEVEYVRRMRRSSNASSMDEGGKHEAIESAAAKKSCSLLGDKGHVRKGMSNSGEGSSPDHGVWITSKPTSPCHLSPHAPRYASSQQDYLSAKYDGSPTASSPDEREQQQPSRSPLLKRPSDDHAIQQALEEEASETRKAAKDLAETQRSLSPSGKTVWQDQTPASEVGSKKWYKIPLHSPLAVSGVS